MSERLMKKNILSNNNDGINMGTKSMSMYIILGILARN